MKNSMIAVFTLGAAFGAALSLPAAAEKVKGPCAEDTAKFCKDVKPGGGRIIACLKEHEAEFSDACKADFAKRKEEKLKKNPCLADMEKLCADIKTGQGRKKDCLKEHEAELSDACKARQAERTDKRKAHKKGKKEKGAEVTAVSAEKPEPAAKPQGN